jgi:hypothetical protein
MDKTVTLAHGAGGTQTAELIDRAKIIPQIFSFFRKAKQRHMFVSLFLAQQVTLFLGNDIRIKAQSAFGRKNAARKKMSILRFGKERLSNWVNPPLFRNSIGKIKRFVQRIGDGLGASCFIKKIFLAKKSQSFNDKTAGKTGQFFLENEGIDGTFWVQQEKIDNGNKGRAKTKLLFPIS